MLAYSMHLVIFNMSVFLLSFFATLLRAPLSSLMAVLIIRHAHQRWGVLALKQNNEKLPRNLQTLQWNSVHQTVIH